MPISETVRALYTKTRLVETDDTLQDAAADTMMFANVPNYCYRPPSTQNAIEIAFTMGADGQACVAYLYAYRKNGDIVLVWDATLTAGKQEATSGEFYVDTIASSTDNWITAIKEVDVSAADRMSRIILDTCGYSGFFVQFTGLSSESARALYSGF
jgi:hypothetical protein